MLKLLIWGGCLIAAGAGGLSAYVRLAPLVPGVWHVDPIGVQRSRRPNNTLWSDVGDAPAMLFDAPPVGVGAALGDVARGLGWAEILGGAPGEGWVTYVVRTPLFGYPDVVSIRILARGSGTALHVYARAVYGYRDFGVNSARVARLAEAMQEALNR